MRKMREKSKLAQIRKRKMYATNNPAPTATFFKKLSWKNAVAGQRAKDLKNGVDAFGKPLRE
jgi:hypothetical protein